MKDNALPLPPPTDPAQSREAIAAEIADHLAAAETELTQNGVAAEEARAAARQKFGDVENIQKTCYWIQNGDAIMLRWTLIALASALCVLLGLSVLGNWRTQSQLAEQVGKLSEELKAMAAAKQAPPAAPQPPEITGVIYAGSKDKPAAGAKVAILRADGSVVRRAVCDENGIYRSGPMEPGDYCVTSPLLEAPLSLEGFVTQSEPIFLHSGSGNLSVSLDTLYHFGVVRIVANRQLPEPRKEGKYRILSRLSVGIGTDRWQWGLWTPVQDGPTSWPIYCRPVVSEPSKGFARPSQGRLASLTKTTLALDQENQAELRDRQELTRYPAGNADCSIALALTIVPIDDQGDAVFVGQRVQSNANLLASLPSAKQSELFYNKLVSIPWASFQDDWREYSDGKLWMEHLTRSRSYQINPPNQSPAETISIKENQVTTIHVELPEGAELEVQKVIEETTDMAQFVSLVNKGLLYRPVKITKTTYEPMEKP